MGNKHSKSSKKSHITSHSRSTSSYKHCKQCWSYKQYGHCCYNTCFESIFNAYIFTDVLHTQWIFTNKHEIELYNILLPLHLEGIIPVIGSFLPAKSNSNSHSQRSKTPKAQTLTPAPFQPLQTKDRALSVPFYVPDIDVSSSSFNTSRSETPVHAYFHGYISLYNRNHPPCFIWMKSLSFDEYDDRQYGKKKKKIQITVLGDVGVGKSTLINKYLTDEFTENYTPTIVDCYTKTVALSDVQYMDAQSNNTNDSFDFDFDTNEMEQNILDTAGGDVIAMAGSIDEWIEQGEIFLLCFDVSRGLTLQYLKSYIIPRIQQHFEEKGKNESSNKYSMNKSNHIGPCALILVGCKVDLRDMKNKLNKNNMNIEIMKNYNAAMQLAKNINIPYIETSSKSPVNVNFLFKQCIFEYWIQTQTNCIEWTD